MKNLTSLFSFCEKDEAAELSSLLPMVSDINEADEKTGWNLIIVAAFHHSYKCFDLLLDRGADINSVNRKGTSVLMYAKTAVFKNRNFSFLKYIISKGADVQLRDTYGKTVYDYVVDADDQEMINFFKEYQR